jgi:transposase
VILAFLSIENFDSAKQVAAFVGLNPKPRQSGSSVLGVGRISKTGDADLRKAFYMPAVVSIRFNPIIKDFAKRLSNAGRAKMVVVIAAMRKLLTLRKISETRINVVILGRIKRKTQEVWLRRY